MTPASTPATLAPPFVSCELVADANKQPRSSGRIRAEGSGRSNPGAKLKP